MAFHIGDAQTDALARELARRTGKGLTESVRLALEAEMRRQEDQQTRSWQELKRFLEKMDQTPRTGRKADKGFFDEINGD